jgi:phage replication-related protein YjqB (UPF0714/DUF867 family)
MSLFHFHDLFSKLTEADLKYSIIIRKYSIISTLFMLPAKNVMANDTYSCFAELQNHENQNKDYKISISDVGSGITIIAPHGGKIEPGTSDIAKKIARQRFNCYCFEGIKKENNRRLHITSHNFDEPTAVKIISGSLTVVAIHACTGNDRFVYLGGLDNLLKAVIADELESRGIIVPKGHGKFKGLNPDNICNRGANKKGVQLEITRGLRDDLNKRQLIAAAVQAALIKITWNRLL